MVPLLNSEDGSITSHRNFGTHLPVDKRNIQEHFNLHRKGSLCAISGSELKEIIHAVIFWDLSDIV
jgi:ABC-type uncharacterized transport system auxiliary subunit